MSGIRAELVFETPGSCPVAELSADADGPLTEISWTGGDGATAAEQFTGEPGVAQVTGEPGSKQATEEQGAEQVTDEHGAEGVEEVFDYGAQSVYQFDRETETPCICEYLESRLGPVAETYALDGDLHVTFHAGRMHNLREVLRECKEQFGDVRVEYLVRGRESEDDSEIIPVDVRRLTERQREVLRTAYEMGYFEYPRGANAGEVAEELGIRPSTFTEHINAAQSKILDELQLDG